LSRSVLSGKPVSTAMILVVGQGMKRKAVVMGASVVAACVLAGLWLFRQHVPPGFDGVQRECVQDQHTVLQAAYLKLKEGQTAEDVEASIVAYCDCFAREVTETLSPQEVTAIGQKKSTPPIDAKLQAIGSQCSPRDP
jgi:hypothetical protein